LPSFFDDDRLVLDFDTIVAGFQLGSVDDGGLKQRQAVRGRVRCRDRQQAKAHYEFVDHEEDLLKENSFELGRD
jgi:hypothetical protein